MDAQDRELLNVIQAEFPVTSRPYAEIGRRIGMDETEVRNRIADLKRRGIIRRMGASINSRRVGFFSTLLAARVPREKFDEFVAVVNSCPGVTHNYERKHEYNVWFTLISPSEADKEATVERLSAGTGVLIREFPAVRIFKIKVDFRF
jgi:siroheme decarboxylase